MKRALSGLIRALDKQLKDVHWLRLMYAYPSCFTDEMIKTLADSPRFVPYIDMPLQHINDEILAKDETPGDAEADWKHCWGNCGNLDGRDYVADDFHCTGSPGETESQHRELLDFVRGIRLST